MRTTGLAFGDNNGLQKYVFQVCDESLPGLGTLTRNLVVGDPAKNNRILVISFNITFRLTSVTANAELVTLSLSSSVAGTDHLTEVILWDKQATVAPLPQKRQFQPFDFDPPLIVPAGKELFWTIDETGSLAPHRYRIFLRGLLIPPDIAKGLGMDTPDAVTSIIETPA